MAGKPLHPLAAFAIRGLEQIARKAARRAVESVAEDFESGVKELGRRARSVQVNAHCECDCYECALASEEEEHCGPCRERRTP